MHDFCEKFVESKKVCHISLSKLSNEVSGSSKGGPCFLLGLSLLLGFRHPGNDVADQFIRSEIAPHLFFLVLILLQTLLGIVGRITIESSQETDVAAMNIQDNEVIVTVINVQPDAYTSSVSSFRLLPKNADQEPRSVRRSDAPRAYVHIYGDPANAHLLCFLYASCDRRHRAFPEMQDGISDVSDDSQIEPCEA